jgi:hypothetical protein
MRYFVNIVGFFPIVCLSIQYFYLGIIERQFFVAFILTVIIFSYWRLQLRCEDNIFAFYTILYTLGAVFFVLVVYRNVKGQPSDERKGIVIGIAIAIAISTSISVLLGIRALASWTECWSGDEEAMATWICEHTPIGAVFLYLPRPLHFVPALTGRQSFCVAEDTLNADGFDPADRIKEMYAWNGSVGSPVQFIVVGADGELVRGLNGSNQWRAVYRRKGAIIYQWAGS